MSLPGGANRLAAGRRRHRGIRANPRAPWSPAPGGPIAPAPASSVRGSRLRLADREAASGHCPDARLPIPRDAGASLGLTRRAPRISPPGAGPQGARGFARIPRCRRLPAASRFAPPGRDTRSARTGEGIPQEVLVLLVQALGAHQDSPCIPVVSDHRLCLGEGAGIIPARPDHGFGARGRIRRPPPSGGRGGRCEPRRRLLTRPWWRSTSALIMCRPPSCPPVLGAMLPEKPNQSAAPASFPR